VCGEEGKKRKRVQDSEAEEERMERTCTVYGMDRCLTGIEFYIVEDGGMNSRCAVTTFEYSLSILSIERVAM